MNDLIEIHVVRASDNETVGRFRFQVLPRKGEQITIPSTRSPGNLAFYIVEEVDHWAERVDDPPTIDGPGTVLLVTEMT